MKYSFLLLLVLFISCKVAAPVFTPIPSPPVTSVPNPPNPELPVPVDTLPAAQPLPPPMALADYSTYFQTGWDQAIQNNLPYYFIPAGRWPMMHPLIGRLIQNGVYRFWRTNLIGAGTAGENDGSGTILDFTNAPHVAFGIGVQCAKGVLIKGIKVWGAFNGNVDIVGSAGIYKTPYDFYNGSFASYTDGVCRDSRYDPYTGIVVDPFGQSVPADGGFPGTDAYGVSLSTYYFAPLSGSTGVHINEVCIMNWVIDIITSPSGSTANADNLTFDYLRVGNSKINFVGCQDQEKNNVIDHVQSWGSPHTLLATNLYGAGSVGNWFLDHFNVAGYTQQLIYNNQGGYYPTYLDHFYAESIARIGPWYTMNGSKMSESTIGFASPGEAGSYTPDQFSGYGVTFDGCQFRIYGWPLPVTILTGLGANDMHFISCSFEGGVPVYPENYSYGYSDFLNCTLNGESSAMRLNPLGPSGTLPGAYAYPCNSGVAGHNILIDNSPHKFTRSGATFTSTFSGDSVTVGDVITATKDFYTYTVAGYVTDKQPGSYTVSYTTPLIDTAAYYYLNKWKMITQ